MKFHVDSHYGVQVIDRLLGYVGETNARRIEVQFDPEAEAELYVLRLDYGAGKIFEVDLTDGSAPVTGSLLPAVQTVRCQFYALHCENGTYTLIRKTNIFEAVIREGIEDTDPVPTYEECVKAVAEMRLLSDAAVSANESAVQAKKEAEAAAEAVNTLGISEAAVGQTVRIKSVDESGKITAWEPVPLLEKPKQVTSLSGTELTLADNTEYRLENVGQLILHYPEGSFECWLRLTFAEENEVGITFPFIRLIGDYPSFGNGETWELSIKDGTVIAGIAWGDE